MSVETAICTWTARNSVHVQIHTLQFNQSQKEPCRNLAESKILTKVAISEGHVDQPITILIAKKLQGVARGLRTMRHMDLLF